MVRGREREKRKKKKVNDDDDVDRSNGRTNELFLSPSFLLPLCLPLPLL